jgi:hypothetical protein
MTAEADFITRLVAAAIPGVGADQISWDERRSGAPLPALVVQQITPGPIYTHDGVDALRQPRWQVTIVARSPAERELIADAVQAAVEPPADVGGTAFGGAFLTMAPDLPAQTVSGGPHVFVRALDFQMSFQPAT